MAGIIDTRVLGKPEKWDGDRKEWRHWSSDVRSWVGAVSGPLAEAMTAVQSRPTPVTPDLLTPEQQDLNRKLHLS